MNKNLETIKWAIVNAIRYKQEEIEELQKEIARKKSKIRELKEKLTEINNVDEER